MRTTPLHGIRALATRPRIAALFVLYGIVLALWGVARFDASIPADAMLMGTRTDGVQASLRTLYDGGPPLLSCERGYTRETARNACYPAGTGDDQGIYLYLPYFAHWAGIRDPPRALKWFFIVCFAALVGVYPLIMWGLFESVLAGLFLPLAVLFKFTFVQNSDIYWIGAWCLLLCLPLLLLVHDRWRPRSILALAGIVVIASFASSIRINAGLPILLGAFVVLLLRRSSWPRVLTYAAVVVLAYLSVYPFGLQVARTYRDHVVGDPSLSARYPARHPIWHNAYIGLGYLPNRYGIVWDDSVSAATVARLNPRAAYHSPEYEATLRKEYFRIALEDPRLVIDNLVSKTKALFVEATARFGVLLLALPVALFVGSAKRKMRRYVLVVAPALPVAAAPPLLTLPVLVYQMNWLGAWAVLWLLAAGWVLTTVPSDVRTRLKTVRLPSPRDGLRLARSAVRSPALWVVVAVVGGVGVYAVAIQQRAAEEAFYRSLSNAVVTSAPVAGAIVSWKFSGGMPSDWVRVSAAQLEPLANAIRVTTNTGRFEYQIAGPDLNLEPGRYEVRARGAVEKGGLELGVLNSDADRWVVTTHYWYGQDGFADGAMVASFALETSTRVRVILSNTNARAAASRWTIQLVEIRHVR